MRFSKPFAEAPSWGAETQEGGTEQEAGVEKEGQGGKGGREGRGREGGYCVGGAFGELERHTLSVSFKHTVNQNILYNLRSKLDKM